MARSARSDSTASDASLEDDLYEKKAAGEGAYHDEADGGDDDSLDEEERVGLMKQHRPNTTRRATSPSPAPSQPRHSRKRLLLYLVALVLCLILVVPLLAWLSSSHPTHNPWAHVDVLIPGFSAPPSPSISAAKKLPPSSNDAKGQYGLANAPSFSVSEYIPGWATPEEADEQLSLFKGTTRKTLARQGWRRLKPVGLDTIFNGTLDYADHRLDWSYEDPDEGVFMTVDPVEGDIVFEDVTHARQNQTGEGKVAKGGGKVTYVKARDVVDEHGDPVMWEEFHPSPDLAMVFFTTEQRDVWRYSKRFRLWVHDVRKRKTIPLGEATQLPTISNAQWVGNTSLAFVQNNDLYIALDINVASSPTAAPIRITKDGTTTTFNGGADWVYEEEILETDHALWVSPGGTKLAYLRFDESDVPIYEFPIYAGGNDTVHPGQVTPYPKKTQMKYPKPGYPNPRVSAHLVDLERLKKDSRDVEGAKLDLVSPTSVTDVGVAGGEPNRVDLALGSIDGQKERLVIDVAWLSDGSLSLVETDRYSDKSRRLVFDLTRSGTKSKQKVKDIVVGKAVRHTDVGSRSWITPRHDLIALGVASWRVYAPSSTGTTAYLEVLHNEAGYAHIAFFSSSTAVKPSRWLTTGEWEVDQLLFADVKRSKVYYSAPLPGQIWKRHIFSVDLDSHGDKAPVDITAFWPASSFEASFDPKGAYVSLRCTGPSIPFTRVVGLDDPSFTWHVQDNEKARNASAQHVKAHTLFYNVTLTTSNHVTATAQELRPHDFDASGSVRYPLLIHVYGGPDSQIVAGKTLRTHWHEVLATQMGYVVVRVDGRGTGFRGQAYREGVARNLGSVEVEDVLATVRELRRLPYVDEKRVGLWGWSYGGYLTAKTIEANSGKDQLLSLGMSVAPPAKWELYDSVYTERFMKSPLGQDDRASVPPEASNTDGYAKSAVHVPPTSGFFRTPYLLAHGTGDDNVHFGNSAQLLDLLESAHIKPATLWTFRAFVDSPHGMSVRGQYRALHEWMTGWLAERWGAGGKRRFSEGGEVAGKGEVVGKVGKKKGTKLLEEHGKRDGAEEEEEEGQWWQDRRQHERHRSRARRNRAEGLTW